MSKFFSRLFAVLTLPAVMLTEMTAQASSHSFIMMGRSSMQRYIFVTQCVEGEYGNYQLTTSGSKESEAWQGYNFRNGVGFELFKFIQFGAFHTFVNLHDKGESSERITGSKLQAEMKFSFAAPVGNLELGGGVSASRLDYQKQSDLASMYGSGIYYLVGVNYFTASQVSVFGQLKQNEDNMIRGSGTDRIRQIRGQTTSVSFGVNIWL